MADYDLANDSIFKIPLKTLREIAGKSRIQ